MQFKGVKIHLSYLAVIRLSVLVFHACFRRYIQIDLLQEFVMIPLDIFRAQMHYKPIETPLEAWLTFLGEDKPERVIELITACPEFKEMYATLYEMCRNTERVMRMFSEELRILDRNTVKYMIEEQQKEIDSYKEQLQQKDEEWNRKLEQKTEELNQKEAELHAVQQQLAELAAELDAVRGRASK